MTEEPRTDTSVLQVAAALLASSVIGAPVFIATVAQMILFTFNPQGIDVSRPLAYALEIGAVFGLCALGAIVAVVLVLARLRARAPRSALRIPYMILALQIVFGVLTFSVFLFTPGL